MYRTNVAQKRIRMNVVIDTAQYEARRLRLLRNLKTNAIVIIPSAQETVRSNDTEYSFRQNSDFYYLTGFNEPDCFLVLSNSSTHASTPHTTLFLRPKDDFAEIWHGRRLGISDAPRALLLDAAYCVDDIDEILPDMLDGHDYLYYALGDNLPSDDIVQCAMSVCKHAPKQSKQAPASIVDVSRFIHAMRVIKSPQEIALMQQSADISCAAHKAAMTLCKPGVFEYQLEATILYTFAMHGARHAAYNSIVGGGENACILHYVENKDALADGDLVLIDAGSEFQGYAADITRTFPVNGRFSEAQKELYNIVLSTQLSSISQLVPGRTIAEVMKSAVIMITQGLLDLGILKGELNTCIEEEAYKAYFMHGLGHYLGLDVHDVGNYKENGHDRLLEAGMVMTVEPGIYVSKKANVPEKYKGIGVRIEDNIVITRSGNEVLTRNVPKRIEDIEAHMAQNSVKSR